MIDKTATKTHKKKWSKLAECHKQTTKAVYNLPSVYRLLYVIRHF